jgi:hypothetical protein
MGGYICAYGLDLERQVAEEARTSIRGRIIAESYYIS